MVSLSALLVLAVLAGQTVGFAQFPSKEEARSSRTIVCASDSLLVDKLKHSGRTEQTKSIMANKIFN